MMGTYETKIQKVSKNTLITAIPKPIVRSLNLQKGDILIIKERSNKLIIEKKGE